MNLDNIKKLYELKEPVVVLKFGPDTIIKKRYASLEDWVQRLAHVKDGKRVVEEVMKHNSITIYDLVNILYPRIVDDESAMAHGAKNYQEYLDLLARCKKYQQEGFIA